MATKIIKEINIKFDENFKLMPPTLQNPNYIQYNIDAYFDKNNCNEFIYDLIYKTFQNHINYSITFSGNNECLLFVENVSIQILVKEKGLSIDNIDYIQLGQKISTFNLLKSITNYVSDIKSKERNKLEIEEKTKSLNNTDDFEFRWELNNNYVIRYKPLDINCLVEYKNGCINFISYLEHEGETYCNGDEKISINTIKANINYYQSLLDHEQIIIEKLTSL
jgi:uncharacterized protein (DUF1499 family)